MRVLLADDDHIQRELLAYALQREGFTVLFAADGAEALERFEAKPPDLVLLDRRMPRVDGLEVCRRLRHEHGSEVPILMLSGLDKEEDVVRGFEAGADDYVIKPFSVKLLLERMRALLRRARSDRYRAPAAEVRVGALVLDVGAHQVTSGGRVVQLTPLEFRILRPLMTNPGRVVPYERLLEYAWGDSDKGSSALLRTHVSHLRAKLDLPARGLGALRAVTFTGYCLEPAASH